MDIRVDSRFVNDSNSGLLRIFLVLCMFVSVNKLLVKFWMMDRVFIICLVCKVWSFLIFEKGLILFFVFFCIFCSSLVFCFRYNDIWMFLRVMFLKYLINFVYVFNLVNCLECCLLISFVLICLWYVFFC